MSACGSVLVWSGLLVIQSLDISLITNGITLVLPSLVLVVMVVSSKSDFLHLSRIFSLPKTTNDDGAKGTTGWSQSLVFQSRRRGSNQQQEKKNRRLPLPLELLKKPTSTQGSPSLPKISTTTTICNQLPKPQMTAKKQKKQGTPSPVPRPTRTLSQRTSSPPKAANHTPPPA